MKSGHNWRTRRRVLAAAAALLATAGILLGVGVCCATRPEMRPSAVIATAECGRLETVEGVKVLTLWGTPRERGLAHGRLLAGGVLDMVDTIGGTNLLLSHTSSYDKTIIPMMASFEFDPDDLAELEGVFDGVKERLGDGAVLKKIGRPLKLDDLKALNTVGDWYRQACSTFAAWGSLTQDGHVWVGRNFDFLPAKAFFAHQMIVVYKRSKTTKAWATAGAPGMIGCITGLNEDGVFTSMHDVFLTVRPPETGYSPRLLVLRRLMETCTATDLEKQALPILEARKQMFDNAVMLAAPVTDGTPPALVFEYNGDRTKDKGVTVRRPTDNGEKLSAEMIVCTNHYRKRIKQAHLLDYRYDLIWSVLMAKTERGEKVDFDLARKTMGAARLLITTHTVIVDLNTGDYWYGAGAYLSPPGKQDYVKLPVKEWLGR